MASGWENLLRDGEYVDEDSDENSRKGGAPVGVATDAAPEGDEDKSGSNGGGEETEKKGNRRSGFMPMLEQWTWGEVMGTGIQMEWEQGYEWNGNGDTNGMGMRI